MRESLLQQRVDSCYVRCRYACQVNEAVMVAVDVTSVGVSCSGCEYSFARSDTVRLDSPVESWTTRTRQTEHVTVIDASDCDG